VGVLGCLTFELRGRQRRDARPRPQTMYTVLCGRGLVARRWRSPLERGVRPRGGSHYRILLIEFLIVSCLVLRTFEIDVKTRFSRCIDI
jgi:hypothetical protein